jgi:hypothetical protein
VLLRRFSDARRAVNLHSEGLITASA